MQYPDVEWSGAVCLGKDVTCDGFISSSRVRVQTHIHSDHMSNFNSSKGYQTILLSAATRQLLISEYNEDLPYRSNLLCLNKGDTYKVNKSKVSLVSCDHMLGAVQVQLELPHGQRIGYSGDFQWPIDDVIKVNSLVIDATNGSPKNVRNYSQGECEERFQFLVKKRLNLGKPVYIYAHRGTIQRALQLLFDEIDCPLIGSERLCKENSVYRSFGYPIGNILDKDSAEGKETLRENKYVRFYGTGDKRPTDTQGVSVIKLSSFLSHPDNPITEYGDSSFGVAISNHADFNGTLEYILETGAKFVITDNTRSGKGHILATEINRRLGIEAKPSSNFFSHEW